MKKKKLLFIVFFQYGKQVVVVVNCSRDLYGL